MVKKRDLFRLETSSSSTAPATSALPNVIENASCCACGTRLAGTGMISESALNS